jgi:hypothetical protein
MVILTAQIRGMYMIFDQNFVSKSFEKTKDVHNMLESGLT